MRALVYHGAGDMGWDEVAEPKLIDVTDAIVRVEAATICGADLRILEGGIPEVSPGRVMGHEAVGTVVDSGAATHRVLPGDRVAISCISACGGCRYCWSGQLGQCCNGGGWLLGHLIDGLQAEYARVPFADSSTYKIPDSMSNEQAVYLSEILPAGYEVGALNAPLHSGNVIVVVGAGPIGISVLLGTRLHTPARVIVVDEIESRLEFAMSFGADAATSADGAREVVDELTDGIGADASIEAVGLPETFELCTELLRPGGRVANIGMHGRPATLHLESLWNKDITITTGVVDTSSIPVVMAMVERGRIDPTLFTTHRFGFDQIVHAYDVFTRAGDTNALKVVVER